MTSILINALIIAQVHDSCNNYY